MAKIDADQILNFKLYATLYGSVIMHGSLYKHTLSKMEKNSILFVGSWQTSKPEGKTVTWTAYNEVSTGMYYVVCVWTL